MSKNYLFFYLLFLSIQLSWSQNIPPIIKATGDQMYCPLTQLPVATAFNIIDPDDAAISELFIQISTGYVLNQEKLLLKGSHPNIKTSWNNTEGKLTLSGLGNALIPYPDLINAVLNVVFESSSSEISGDRFFSFSIGNANYLPSTGHYYEFISARGITWNDAKTAASNLNYYGLRGYLATIGSDEESQLAGEQASGAGWIGGTDEVTEGVWKWATGPETGTIFWNGGINGSTPASQYANWNTEEPNNLDNENYAHITAPGEGIRGSWNDLSNTGANNGNYQPKGFIVEYGGMPGDTAIDISASTKISINRLVSTTGAVRCGPGSLILSAVAAPDTVVRWYAGPSGGVELASGTNFTTPILTTTTIYYVLSSYGGCTNGLRTPVVATVNYQPTVPSTVIYKNCDEDGVADGFTDFNLNGITSVLNPTNLSDLNMSYHLTTASASADEEALNMSLFNNATASTIYARAENAAGCFAVTIVNLEVSTTSFPLNYIQELEVCDDDRMNDGFYTFDLASTTNDFLAQFPTGQNLRVYFFENQEDAQLGLNEIKNTSAYINSAPFSHLIYVRVESDDGNCYGVGPYLQLRVNALPEFSVDQSENFCLDGAAVILKAHNPNENYSYIWTDATNLIISTAPTVTVASAGIYTVTAISQFGCESLPIPFEVAASGIANLKQENVTITDLSEVNTITIDTSTLGIGNYEFSLGSSYGPYQDSPIFTNVSIGAHTLYVNDKNGCGIAELQVNIMGFPKYFTPNHDSYNDTWNIKGFEGQFSPRSYIDIYNRYGLFLKRIHPDGLGWNGLFNGKALPATDYWFKAYFSDENGQARLLNGHFSLVR